MTLTLIPDAEKLVSDYLRDVPEVAAIVGRRVVGKSPGVDGTAEPWVLLRQLGAPSDPRSKVDHLVAFILQLDCYAGADGGQPEANLLGSTVRGALMAMPGETFTGAVVSRVVINGDARIPDVTYETARERRIVTATVWMHG